MKRIAVTVVLVGALLGLPLGATFANAQSSSPFRAAYAGSAALQGCNPVMCQLPGRGTGYATALGQSSAAYNITLDKESPATAAPCELAWITATFRAKGGDQVSVSGSGTACSMAGTPALALSFSYTVTGGTGRFTGAGGSGSAQGTLDSSAGTAGTTWNGTVVLPG
jgi:hypothetical protein